MPEIVKFKAFCLERYKYAHNLRGSEALNLFKQYGVMEYIDSFYDVLHTFGDKYIVANIHEFIEAEIKNKNRRIFMNTKKINPRELQGNVFDLIGDKWMLITPSKSAKYPGFNSMTASWGSMGIMWGKPVANCVIRPVRYTYDFMEAAECFTLSFFPEKYRDAMNVFGKKSGRDCDKLALAKEHGLEPYTSGNGNETEKGLWFFAEADITLVCRKIYYQDIDPANFIDKDIDKNYPNKDYHRMYTGEIIDVRVK